MFNQKEMIDMKYLIAILLVTSVAYAKKPFELGVTFDILSSNEEYLGFDRVTSIIAPEASRIYALWPLGGRLAIGPTLHFDMTWFDENNNWIANVGMVGTYYFIGWQKPSLYVEGRLGGVWHDGSRDGHRYGPGIGYQIPRPRLFVWRVAVKWNRFEINRTSKYSDRWAVSLSLGKRWR